MISFKGLESTTFQGLIHFLILRYLSLVGVVDRILYGFLSLVSGLESGRKWRGTGNVHSELVNVRWRRIDHGRQPFKYEFILISKHVIDLTLHILLRIIILETKFCIYDLFTVNGLGTNIIKILSRIHLLFLFIIHDVLQIALQIKNGLIVRLLNVKREL